MTAQCRGHDFKHHNGEHIVQMNIVCWQAFFELSRKVNASWVTNEPVVGLAVACELHVAASWQDECLQHLFSALLQ